MTKAELIEIIIAMRPVLRHQRAKMAHEKHAFLEAQADYFTAPTPEAKQAAKRRMFAVRMGSAA